MKQSINSVYGSSVLEVAIVSLLSLSMLFGAVGVSDVVMTSYRLSRTVDLIAYDHSLKPLAANNDGRVVLNEAGLGQELRALADRSLNALTGSLLGENRDFRLEIELGIVMLDPRSGRVERIITMPNLTQTRGTLAIPASIREKTNFDREFERLAGRRGEVSQFAVPLPGGIDQSAAFFSSIVLLGVRACWSFTGSPTARVLQRLGLFDSEVLFDWKVVPLRAEVK